MPRPRLIFVTGTDTGVGKTLLTALLLGHLRGNGQRAWALKPFCSGGRGDALILRSMQNGELNLEEINPFYFTAPVTPLVAAWRLKRKVSLKETLKFIRTTAARLGSLAGPASSPAVLLIEGAGGLLSPLGEGFSAAEIIEALDCEVLLVARNTLGTLNHTLMTARLLGANGTGNFRRRLRARKAGEREIRVALMEPARRDASSESNPGILAGMLPGVRIVSVPHLGAGCNSGEKIRKKAAKIREILEELSGAKKI